LRFNAGSFRGQGERPAERAVERGARDRHSGLDQRVVQRLGVVGGQPQRHPDPRPRARGVQVDAGQRLTHREGGAGGGEHHRVRWADRRPAQPEVGLVEGGGAVQVADLQGDEVGSGDGHDGSPLDVRTVSGR